MDKPSISSVGVIFPKEYLCSQRVVRKIQLITQNIKCVRVLTNDISHPISIEIEKQLGVSVSQICSNVTLDYLIVFCDEHSLTTEEKQSMARMDRLRVRVIYTPITRVVNIKRLPKGVSGEDFSYIGRGTPFGNPYSVATEGSKEVAISKFSYDFERGLLRRGDEKELAITRLLGKFIACSCHPMRCHGDVISGYLNSIDIDEIEPKLKKQCWFNKFVFSV
ncbi:DUF4326 domain-containing protein [Vibrio parahaemolyticus]